MDVVPAALIFYTLGFYARKTGIIEKALSSFENELMMFFTGIIGTIMVLAYNGYVNLHGLQFGNAIFYIAGGIIGTLIIVSASRLTIRTNTDLSKTVKSIVTFYGTNSLIILGIQSLLIRLYIEFCNRVFETQLSLYQFPLKHTVISTTIIGFIICPIVCIFWKFMKSMSFTVR